MPFSSGTFSRIYNWVNEQLSSPIEISKLDAQEEDFATALNNCILRDGTGLPTAAMDWNGQNLTNVAAFTATGIVTGGRFVPTSSSVPTNGMYLSAANTLAFSSNTTLRWSVNSTGTHTLAAPSSGTTLVVPGLTGTAAAYIGVLGLTNNPRVEITGTEASALAQIDFTGSTGSAAGRISRAGTAVIDISSARAVSVAAPSSGVALTVNAASGQNGLVVNGSGASINATINGGSGSPCYLALVDGQTGTRPYRIGVGGSSVGAFDIYDGTAAAFRLSIGSAGNVTINAPSSGTGLTIGGGGADITGTVTATTFSGSGASLTALNASNLSSGTVPDARFPATLPAASGVNLTALNASNLASGTVPDARFPATLPAASGANLTALNASNLSSGTVATGRISGSYTGITAIGNATALDDAAAAQTLGWRDMPQNASSSVTLALSDRGKHVYASGTTSTVAIPANGTVAFPVGSTIVLVNDGSGNMTVSITTDTLAWLTGGTESTGTRTVATKSVVTLVKVTSTRWIITGAGIS